MKALKRLVGVAPKEPLATAGDRESQAANTPTARRASHNHAGRGPTRTTGHSEPADPPVRGPPGLDFRWQTGAATSTQAETAVGETGQSACWCCGQITDEDALVHLENHPEVGICVRCVRFLSRRAGDHQASARRRHLRGAADSIRGQVMSRGWHERPVIGPVLLWINRHVSW